MGKLVYLHFWHQHIVLRSAQGRDAHIPCSRCTYLWVWTSSVKSDRSLSGFNLFPSMGTSLTVFTAFRMMHQVLWAQKIWFIHHDSSLHCYTSRKSYIGTSVRCRLKWKKKKKTNSMKKRKLLLHLSQAHFPSPLSDNNNNNNRNAFYKNLCSSHPSSQSLDYVFAG